jgi:hypothetical protein
MTSGKFMANAAGLAMAVMAHNLAVGRLPGGDRHTEPPQVWWTL